MLPIHSLIYFTSPLIQKINKIFFRGVVKFDNITLPYLTSHCACVELNFVLKYELQYKILIYRGYFNLFSFLYSTPFLELNKSVSKIKVTLTK